MNHRAKMFDAISHIIEEAGKDDPAYDNFQKAADVLEILESLSAYTLFTICQTTDQVRDVCEESYMNMKRQALRLMYKRLEEEKVAAAS